jgi:hypothetical protein
MYVYYDLTARNPIVTRTNISLGASAYLPVRSIGYAGSIMRYSLIADPQSRPVVTAR